MRLVRSFFCLAVLSAGFFICLFFPGLVSAKATEVIWHVGENHITMPTVWQTGEVHAIGDYSTLAIDKGASLTIEPGVIVKIGYNSIFRVNGELLASGTNDNLIYFVSLRDDTIGGDTNGDGSATVASSDDWRYIDIDSYRYNSLAKAEFNYVVIKHGGRGIPRGTSLSLSKAVSFKVDNCDISDNKGVIFIDSASSNVSITNSNLYNPSFCDYASSTDLCHWDNGIKSFSSKTINLSNNYWGSAAGPTYTTGTMPTVFSGAVLANLVGANMSWQPFATKPFEFGVKKINPVIVIPGLMGSWQNWQGEWEIDPILHTYDDLLDAMRLAGYKDGETLFTFPYQWRQSNVITAEQLRTKINEVKIACRGEGIDCSQVDLVTHSMGGLVARAYIEGNNYQNDVDQLIFIATPHKGAPKAYLMWEGGEMEKTIDDKITSIILKNEAKESGYFGDGSLMRYIKDKQVDSVKELLPVYHYLFDYNNGNNSFRYYPNNYPRNEFLESLNSIENLDKLKNVKILNILGETGLNTLNALYLVDSTKPNLWADGMPRDFYGDFKNGLFYGEGDSTVPKLSNNNFIGLSNLIINQDHRRVVAYAQKEVIKELTGNEPTTEIYTSYFPDLLLLAMHSPADFMVTAPDGKRIGRDLVSSDPIVINEIPGAFYSGFNLAGQAEFVVIPSPVAGDYKITALGVDNGGAYSVSADFISETTSTQTVYEGQILPNQTRQITFSLDDGDSFGLIKVDISLESAITDVNNLYNRGLLLKQGNKQKIIQQYKLLELKIKVYDKLIDLAISGLEKINNNQYLKAEVKSKLIALADQELVKLRLKKTEEINEIFRYLDKYLNTLVAEDLLKPLGYGIIKANNDYLINNL